MGKKKTKVPRGWFCSTCKQPLARQGKKPMKAYYEHRKACVGVGMFIGNLPDNHLPK